MILNLEGVPHPFKNYVKLVDETDLIQALRISGHRMLELVHFIKEDKADFSYEAGKWTIREVLCHVIDSERIFAYRALRFARNDETPLPGFEEKDYAPQSNASGRSLKRIADELAHLRVTTIELFEGFTPEMLHRKGKASSYEVTVAALGFVIAGHETHHRKLLMERYMSQK